MSTWFLCVLLPKKNDNWKKNCKKKQTFHSSTEEIKLINRVKCSCFSWKQLHKTLILFKIQYWGYRDGDVMWLYSHQPLITTAANSQRKHEGIVQERFHCVLHHLWAAQRTDHFLSSESVDHHIPVSSYSRCIHSQTTKVCRLSQLCWCNFNPANFIKHLFVIFLPAEWIHVSMQIN